ncbi:MAG: c-type cytochrome [Achromobacter sp.]|uniref:cytochrome c oxidase subunit II n=1 Tax=Achromobacter sp. TaxID=134375 RepID=UPI0029B60A7A|nr:c-type cytochrome [Achromobacter sp.]MDX3983646.1 c-type cytochrome [Achromobacter sp.]
MPQAAQVCHVLTRGMAAILSYVLATAQADSAGTRLPAAMARGPAGDGAHVIADISQVLFIGATAIFVVVFALVAVALFGSAAARRRLSSPALIVGAGIAFPVVALTALLVYVLSAGPSMAGDGAKPAVRIAVKGELWWWRVRYHDASGAVLFDTANDIRIPVGAWVEFELSSDNVIHSFWVPELAGKLDMIPGRVNRLRVRAQAAGTFTGQCAEYCGAQHANMKFNVVALEPDAYQAWQDAQVRPAEVRPAEVRPAEVRPAQVRPAEAPPAQASAPTLHQGERVFKQACAQCHTVRGTAARGTLGPDLTHVGSRLSLAAGVLPNNVGALAGWIADSQHIKPGNPMPSFNQLPGEDLRAVARYLESLK